LKNIVEASSAIAAPPAKALPMPLALCSINAKPDAAALPDIASNAAATDQLTIVCLIIMISSPD
jgi:hypothetical protein